MPQVNFVPDMQAPGSVLMPPASRVGGRERIHLGNIANFTTQLATGDVIILARIPSDAVILEFSVGHDDLDGGGAPTLAMDVGLCDKDGNNLPTSSNSRQCFTDAYTASGAVALTDRRFPGVTAANVLNMPQPAWQLAGMTSNVNTPVVFCCLRASAAANGAPPAAANIFFRIRFMDNS
jgi:hypothetical protein